MGSLKFFANFAVGTFMFVCISLIFLSLSLNNLFENTINLDEEVVSSITSYVQDHKEEVKQYVIEAGAENIADIPNLNKESIKQTCLMPGPNMDLPESLCGNLDSLTEENARKQFLEAVIDLQLESGAFDQQINQISEMAKEKISGVRQQVTDKSGPINMYLIIGIIGYIVSVLLLFIISNSNIKLALYKVGRNTFLDSMIFVLSFGYIALLTPSYITGLMSSLAGEAMSKIPLFILNLVASLALDVLKASTNPLLILAIIMSVISLALAVIMRILLKQEGAIKEQPEKKQ